MNCYRDQVLPRLTNVVMAGRAFSNVRARVAADLAGEVLEIGFGSGLNLPFYPTEVRRILAVDPAVLGRKLAAKRIATSTVPIEFVGQDGENLPLEPESVDHVLITWTMCTIPAVENALREMYRVLRPGGAVHFAEHGRSPDPTVALWQERLNPLQRMWAGGCNLNRPIDRLLTDAGFQIVRLRNFYIRGPKPIGYMYEGVASRAANR